MTKIHLTSGFIARTKQADNLVSIIEGWIEAHIEYAEIHEDNDVAYYFNERANISMLAAGAWKSGAVALEEFTARKGIGADKRHGRVDLYISTREWNAEIEAKHKWMNLALSDEKFADRVNETIAKATGDALLISGAWHRYACAFFVPSVRVRQYDEYAADPEAMLQTELQRYLAQKKPDIWAWCFPDVARRFRLNKETYYPGVVMALKRVNFPRTER